MTSPRTTARRSLLTGLATLPLWLSGCQQPMAAMGLKTPKIGLDDVDFEDVGLTRVMVLAQIRVDNPNPIVLPIASVQCQFEVLGVPMGEGTSLQSVSIPASGSGIVPVRLEIPTRRLLEVVRNMTQRSPSSYGYRITGEARWGALNLAIPFEHKADLKALTDLLPWPIPGGRPPSPPSEPLPRT